MTAYIKVNEVTYVVSDDKEKLQIDVIYQYLTDSYWSKGISKELLQKAIDNSLCFAVYHNQSQIGFARVITDSTTFAYLADVFILPQYQGIGLAKELIGYLMKSRDIEGLRRIMLCTKDAHGLYKHFGFTGVDNPEIMMQINKPTIYLNTK